MFDQQVAIMTIKFNSLLEVSITMTGSTIPSPWSHWILQRFSVGGVLL